MPCISGQKFSVTELKLHAFLVKPCIPFKFDAVNIRPWQLHVYDLRCAVKLLVHHRLFLNCLISWVVAVRCVLYSVVRLKICFWERPSFRHVPSFMAALVMRDPSSINRIQGYEVHLVTAICWVKLNVIKPCQGAAMNLGKQKRKRHQVPYWICTS